MEKEEILFLALFLASWVLSLLAKKFKKNQKSGQQKGFTSKILEFIAALQEADGKKMHGQAPVEPQPTPLTFINEKAVASAAVSQTARGIHAKSTATPIVKEHYKKTATPSKASVVAPRINRGGKKFSKQKMRTAIVWSEIIGTPVGLRDN